MTEQSDALIPMPLRLPSAVVAVLSAAATFIFGSYVAGTSTASGIDRWLASGALWLLSDVPALSLAIVHIGDLGPMIVMTVLLAALCGLLRRPYHALLSVTAPAVVVTATTLLKPAIGRTFEGIPAFPSGHTAAVSAFAAVAGLLLVSLAHGRLAVTVPVAAMVLLSGAAMGSAVVAENWHYPTDAVGGFCTAITLVLALALLLDWIRCSSGRLYNWSSSETRHPFG